jgi:hypothetical protein
MPCQPRITAKAVGFFKLLSPLPVLSCDIRQLFQIALGLISLCILQLGSPLPSDSGAPYQRTQQQSFQPTHTYHFVHAFSAAVIDKGSKQT